GDNTPNDNTATDTDTLTPVVGLAITKTDGQTTAVPGTSTTYTIVVSNAGPSSANGATISDPLPVGVTSATWTFVGATGGGAVTGAVVADPLPTGVTGSTWTFTSATGGGSVAGPVSGTDALLTTVNLPVNATVTFTYTVQVSPSATGSLVNAATAVLPPGVTD